MVSELPLVREICTLLAVAGGRDDRAISVDECVLEELRRLRSPDVEAALVDRVLQRIHIAARRDTPAEISGCCRVRDASRPEHVEIVLVVPQQLQVLQALPTREKVVRDVGHMVGLVVREMDLQQLHPPVDLTIQPDGLDQSLNQRDTSRGNRAYP